MKPGRGAILLAFVIPTIGLAGSKSTVTDTAGKIVIDAKARAEPVHDLPFAAGGRSPAGHLLSINNRYLTLDGAPWLPVMGEFHYARYPDAEWETEILKMKAGGVQIVATYIFWIHHEEVEGQFDWSGRRSLRRFVELCGRHGMYAWVRVGPWAHGESRNGGLPDWLLRSGPVRENDPGYLAHVDRYFREISKQITGLLWRDGGPVIGLQVENEYSARGPGKGEEHVLMLRRMLREAGLDTPFYSVTAWDNAAVPAKDVIPVFGGYADGFWWRSLGELPPNANFFFTPIRCQENVGDDLRSSRPDLDARYKDYPFLTAEMGGGMAQSYHRRPVLSPDDTAAMAVTKLGAGAVAYGYYMFHGGTNPDGKLNTFQESQASGSLNDLPLKGYDYQAPLGEFGQMHPVFSDLKILHLFLHDFGAKLAPMTVRFPQRIPAGKSDTGTPRVTARIEGGRGFVFVNNYQRSYPLPDRKDFQVELQLPSGAIDVPRRPAMVPANAYIIWPVNLDLGGATLRYATAQLVGKLDDPATLVFFAWPGIAPEFAFDGTGAESIDAANAHVTSEAGHVFVDGLKTGTDVAIRIRRPGGKTVTIVVLSRDEARQVWKAELDGKERLLLSPSDLWFERDQIHMRSRDAASMRVGIYPALAGPVPGFAPEGQDGVFQQYCARVEPVSVEALVSKVREGRADPVKMGAETAIMPSDEAFAHAAVWKIQVPSGAANPSIRLLLGIDYVGDIARIYAGDRFITDEFYHGAPLEIGLWRTGPDLELRVLPLRGDAPIYLPAGTRAHAGTTVAEVKSVKVIPEYETTLRIR
jgi:beta-galactosidase